MEYILSIHLTMIQTVDSVKNRNIFALHAQVMADTWNFQILWDADTDTDTSGQTENIYDHDTAWRFWNTAAIFAVHPSWYE